jgi:dipeptidyl aminopeptidase/acylaminoacyl peptidase
MSEPAWKRRFTEPTISDMTWAPDKPSRLGIVSTEGGSSQAWSWDMASGNRLRVSTEGVGAEEVHILADGSHVVWWLDARGDERGRWMATPFAGGPASPLIEGAPEGWTLGISIVPGITAVGIDDDNGYSVQVSKAGGPAHEIYRNAQPAGVGAEWPMGPGGLSPDGSWICIWHSEDSDITHPALRVLGATSGATVRDLRDEGLSLASACWSPNGKLAVVQERSGIERPGVWDPATGDRTDVELPDIPGPAIPIDWFADGKGMLVIAEYPDKQVLLRHDVDEGTTTEILSLEGTIGQAGVRPDGDVWFIADSGTKPPAVQSLRGGEVPDLGAAPPPGRPFQPIEWTNPNGDTIHGFVVTPLGDRPHPTIVSVHGGPGWHHTDGWDPGTQAFVDSGFAVLLVNYRGSTGRGRMFREALHSNIGFPESEDINSGLDHVIRAGIADRNNVFLEGWSWGGYLATLNAGLHPDRWRAVMAGIPVGDYVASHYECAPAIRAWDLAIIGGSPMDLPVLYKERNPMTYVDRVEAPMLLIAGENDSRCPLGQVMTYAHALAARDHPVEVELYPGGHHALQVSERVRHVELTIDFFLEHMSRA